ncbi:HXXEE domain-containing protein [uncultured Abiotrophia sp.]|uniref:HXXEE domain-containing protein n=1 Tax=uncultured Abiotrophia sp. TaxID=316094 RepID=UPI00262D4A30|nr:HXXEE domain-containing protein [uncultured Abiotrophia sp.]
MENLLWLFPVIFMLHEMEEIIGFGPWLDKNQAIINKYPRIAASYEHFSPSGFALAVLEEYLLVIIITGASLYFANYLVWLGALIAFCLHLIIHLIQSILIRKYIPALASSLVLLPPSILIIKRAIAMTSYSLTSLLISTLLCVILMVVNLAFAHKLMRLVTKTIKSQKA